MNKIPWTYRTLLVPATYTEKHFLFLIGVKKNDFVALVKDKRDLCYIEKQEKKNGGYREIWKPNRDLKQLLRKINHRYLSRLSFPEFIHCGPQGRSIITAVKGHRHFGIHLSLDVSSFFDSVSEEVVRKALTTAKVRTPIINLIVAAAVAEDKLPQGFPTSSLLSSLVMSQALQNFYGKFERGNILFSIYADDILLSANDTNALLEAKSYIEAEIAKVGLALNSKELLAKNGEQFNWLSLQIYPWVTLPRKELLALEKKIYEYKLTGEIPDDFKPKKQGNRVEQWEEHLKGKAVFASSVSRNALADKVLKDSTNKIQAN